MVTTPVTSAEAAFAIATTGPGRILGFQVQTASSGIITFWDSATAASGTVLGVVPASPTVASNYWVQFGPPGIGMPYANGIWCVAASSSSSGTALTSPNCPNDGRPAI